MRATDVCWPSLIVRWQSISFDRATLNLIIGRHHALPCIAIGGGLALPPLPQSKNCEDPVENPAEPETAYAFRTRPLYSGLTCSRFMTPPRLLSGPMNFDL